MIRSIEELSINAWPSLQTFHYDGWTMRFSEGYTRRANSVQTLYPSTRRIDRKIAFCEQRYRDRGLPAIFKMTPATLPEDLDALLEASGYRREAETSVQTLDLVRQTSPLPLQTAVAPIDSRAAFEETLSEAWIQAFCAYNAVAPQNHAPMQRMLESILPDHCFASVHVEGEIAALGLAVREQSHVGLFDIVTAPPFRRQGWGQRLVAELLDWGRRGGALRAYLQVMRGNAEAERLYARFGFTELYPYWYRVKPRTIP